MYIYIMKLIKQSLINCFYNYRFTFLKFILYSTAGYFIFIYFFSIVLLYHIFLIEILFILFLLLLLYNAYSSIFLSKYMIQLGGSVFLILSFLMFFGWAYTPNWVIFYLYIKFYFKNILIFMNDILWVLKISL